MFQFLLGRFYPALVLVYLLIAAEQVCYLIRPFVFGAAIEEAVKTQQIGTECLYCVLNEIMFMGFWLVNLFVKNRVFARMSVAAMQEAVARGLAANEDTSTVQGRTKLAEELVKFFSDSFPKLCKELGTLVVSLALLIAFGWLVFAINFAMLIVGILVIPRAMKIVSACAEEKHKLMEKDTDVFSRRNKEEIQNHLMRYLGISIKWSDQQSICSGILLNIGAAIVFISIGIVCVGGQGFRAAWAVHRYSANICGNLEQTADAVQMITKIRNILNRIK